MAATTWLQPWHDFFLLIGGASATLLGLVFVAASIAGAIPNDKLGTSETRALWTLPIIGAFGRTLAFAGLGLFPGLTPLYFGCGVLFLAGGDLLYLFRVARGLVAHNKRVGDMVASDWIWNLALPIGASSVALGMGVALLQGNTWAMYPLAAVVALHLTAGVHNAWELMDFLVTLQ